MSLSISGAIDKFMREVNVKSLTLSKDDWGRLLLELQQVCRVPVIEPSGVLDGKFYYCNVEINKEQARDGE